MARRRNYGLNMTTVEASIGDEFSWIYNKKEVRYRFIKVTKKGFNLLNLDTHRCIFRHHMYAVGYGGKSLPYPYHNLKFWAPDNGLMSRLVNENRRVVDGSKECQKK